MQCPSCGYSIADSQATTCPNCGRSLAAPTPAPFPAGPGAPAQPATPYGASGGSGGYAPMSGVPPTYPLAQDPGATTGAPAAAEGQPAYPAYPAYPAGYPAPTSQGLPPGYGQPGMPSQGFPPTYGQPGAPSQGYPAAYGQPGAPSQGMPGYPYGYPPAYGQPGAPSQGFYRQAIPAAPAKKRNPAGVIISVILAVVVVAGLLTAGLLTLSHSQGSTTADNNNGQTTGGANPTATSSGKAVVFTDPLTSNSNGWADDQHCFFGSDGYHVKDGYDCFVPTDVPNNFTLQVTVKQINGPTNYGYGISFRRASAGNEYFFAIDGNGHWRIDKCVNNSCSALADWSSSGGAIQAGLNKENTLEVDGDGSHFDFFANSKKIGQINDSTYSSGGAGLSGGSNLEVVYTNITINQILH